MKKVLSLTIVILLLFTNALSLGTYSESYALTTYKEVTKYHLDLGVIHIWGVGNDKESATYQKGLKYNTSHDFSVKLPFPRSIEKVVRAYVLNSASFKWNGADYSFNETEFLTDGSTFDNYYSDFTSNNINNIAAKLSDNNTVNLSYTASLKSRDDFNLSEMLQTNQFDYIIEILGGQDRIDKELYDLLVKGNETKPGPGVFGFIFFVPIVIEYTVLEAIEIPDGDFIPYLDVPTSAKQNEVFSVVDETIFDKESEFDHSELYYAVDGGPQREVSGWNGRRLGTNTNQSFPEICTVKYTLYVTNTFGEEKSVSKTVNITDGREIDGEAILLLPEYTYEGHPALAEDVSEFTVDGIGYSATRAYEEGVATNSFRPLPSGSAAVKKQGKTKADIIFDRYGNYDVRLFVNLKTGGTLTDTKPIEVRKTPHIVDNLSGFQKQNRKQTLSIDIATMPGKPIAEYYVELLDMKTGQAVTLTNENPQVNNATIKTRTIASSRDEYWTNFRLEFLTKNPERQNYRYTIYVKDSKGDTDSVQKVFEVAPDLPPVAKIKLSDSFLREKGTNLANIISEDLSTTDGDQLERYWSVGGKDVTTLPGYEDQSFGSGLKVKYRKTGVGKETVTLKVKDVWTEPTLEEYVTDADRLSATTQAVTDVINIAPVVSLEPVLFDEINVALLTDQRFKSKTEEKVNTLISALIGKQFDASILVAPLQESYTGAPVLMMDKTWRSANMCSCGNCRDRGFSDGEYSFVARRAEVYNEGYYDYCRGPITVYAFKGNAATGQADTVWSYTGGATEVFTISEDKTEKYIFLHKANSTVLLNRNTGAVVTTISKAIGKTSFVSEDGKRIYVIEENAVMKYDTADKSYAPITNYGGSFARLQDGLATFVSKTDENQYAIVRLDLKTEAVKMNAIPGFVIPHDPRYTIREDLKLVDVDITGKMLFTKSYRDNYYSDSRTYFCVYVDPASGYTITESYDPSEYSHDWGFVKDETDKAVGIYRLHFGGDSSKSDVVRYLQYRDIKPDGSVTAERSVLSDTKGKVSSGKIIYARKHTAENKIYIVQGSGEYYSSNGSFPIETDGVTVIMNAASGAVASVIKSTASFGGLSSRENGAAVNGNLLTSSYLLTGLNGGKTTLKQIRVGLSQAQAQENSFQKYVKDKVNDLVYFVSNGALDPLDVVAKAKDKAASRAAVKVNVSGTKGTISKKVALDPNETYYAEYSIKPLSDSGTVSVKTTQVPSKVTNDEIEYVVTDENLEDFSSSVNTNPFFVFSNKSNIKEGWYSEDISRRVGNNDRAQPIIYSSTITFTIPAGKKAVLSFDYYINLTDIGGNEGIWQNGFKIDGKRWSRTMGSGSGHYTHPYLLAPGKHTIEVFSKVHAATIYNHSTRMDNLSVAYAEPRETTTVLKASAGQIQTFKAPANGTYKVQLYGPESDSFGGLVEGTIDLKANETLEAYLGSGVPRATTLPDSGNGSSGNGYGSDGFSLSKISFKGKAIAIAGGGGSNGNDGSGTGELIKYDSGSAELDFRCQNCGRNPTTITNNKCDNCNSSRIVLKNPCSTCKLSIYPPSGTHKHYYYEGTGGKGGLAGIGGSSTITMGLDGELGSGEKHWRQSTSYEERFNNYTTAYDGGKGGNGGASWLDSSVLKSGKLTPGGSYGESRLVITRTGTAPAVAYGTKETSETKDSEGWISGRIVIKSEPTITGYSATDFIPRNYDGALSQRLITRSNTTGLSETFTYTVPSDQVSVLTQIAPRFEWTNVRDNQTIFGYKYDGKEYTLLANSSSESGPLWRLDGSLYNFSTVNVIGTHTLAGYQNASGNKYDEGRKQTFFENINLNLLDTDKMNPSFHDGYYFLEPETFQAVYANAKSPKQKTIEIEFNKGEYLIKDFRFYSIKDGKKVYVDETNNDVGEYNKNWIRSSGVKLEGHIAPVEEKEEAPMVYKKGQLVAYNIFYDDYEKDPSKKQYWRYTHTPFNDGEHPDAAYITDSDGNIIRNTGKILSSSIPRFYIDGKYVVEHWQEDNTNRTGDTSGKVDYSKYDKGSNVETVTFYVQGGGAAPWITSIKTAPATVKEGAAYKLQIGVDDAEKDVLELRTEVYKEGKLIYTHTQKNITANTMGVYPVTTTGSAPIAQVGKYTVVCTVRDWSGVGIGSYAFTVVSEGKITGMVSHTPKWDENRKKYNLKRFDEEGNRVIPYEEYFRIAPPRMRGTNIFWAGEQFVLNAETEGAATQVAVSIFQIGSDGRMKDTGYTTSLSKGGSSGTKTAWTGSLWNQNMINRWGRKEPEKLIFLFTATFSGGMERTDQAEIIIDNYHDYWQLHRLW